MSDLYEAYSRIASEVELSDARKGNGGRSLRPHLAAAGLALGGPLDPAVPARVDASLRGFGQPELKRRPASGAHHGLPGLDPRRRHRPTPRTSVSVITRCESPAGGPRRA